ncbi:hypothetical protein [Chamaesiphon sp. OTE_8_metabat_110]|uniref:hypothetical protein n=1 Tax=Chamaesiphon sp. OTE_8_metabat_110 TaxID=2964696 RepID=UPI00286B268B|nr:hypothetical protein [Chamaesiphon sp. OTE_8_metabat_110]
MEGGAITYSVREASALPKRGYANAVKQVREGECDLSGVSILTSAPKSTPIILEYPLLLAIFPAN